MKGVNQGKGKKDERKTLRRKVTGREAAETGGFVSFFGRGHRH